MEAEISFEVLSNFADKSLKWKFSDEQFGRFLVPTNFTQGHCSGAVSVWLLDAPSGRRRFSGSLKGTLENCLQKYHHFLSKFFKRGPTIVNVKSYLGSQLFSWSFSSGRLSSGLLGSCHLSLNKIHMLNILQFSPNFTENQILHTAFRRKLFIFCVAK